MKYFQVVAVAILLLSTKDVWANPCVSHSTGEFGVTGAETSDYQNLGNGLVMFHLSNWDFHWSFVSAMQFRVESCESGQYVDVVYSGMCFGEENPICAEVGLRQEGSFEVDPVPIEAAIIDIARSSDAITLRDLIGGLKRYNARPVEPITSGFESCGCAVFYPELVGDKKPNRVRETIENGD